MLLNTNRDELNKKSSSKTKKDTLDKKENKIFNNSQKSEYLELILRTRIF